MKVEVKEMLVGQETELKSKVEQARWKENGFIPKLAVIKVGTDPSSSAYVKNKIKVGERVGVRVPLYKFPEDVTQDVLLANLEYLNKNDEVHGIIVQLPLPKHLDEELICNAVNPDKDVDGFHPLNVGKLHLGDNSGFVPCTAKGSMDIIEDIHGKNLSGYSAVVVGRSNIVGKPMAKLLLDANATVTTCHSRTGSIDMKRALEGADIIVVAVGKKWFLDGKDFNLKSNATLIDVGINVEIIDGKRKLFGDINPNCHTEGRNYTTVPGGVGMVTCFNVIDNTYISAKRMNEK